MNKFAGFRILDFIKSTLNRYFYIFTVFKQTFYLYNALMSYSTATELILNNLCIYPRTGTTLTEQLIDCYKQFNEEVVLKYYSRDSIIKQTLFISVANNSEYIQSKRKLLSCAKDFFIKIPPTSIIAQTPEHEMIVLELTIIEGLQANEIIHRENNKSSWLVINRCGSKMLIATGSCDNSETDKILQQSTLAFSQIQDILMEEEMEFSNIVRQWNYIEQITRNVTLEKSTSQHYQIFNDVRSKFFNQADFINGYPAATGIGTDCGGITIDIIATGFGPGCSTSAIKSPVQLDAYSYSTEVLAENNTMSDFCRTSPKFERAKLLITPEYKWIFISGTAAIKGQVSVPVISAGLQTEMTIQNIMSLISIDNLQKHGINANHKIVISHLRVYVKFRADIPEVKNICLKYFPNIPTVYIIADICRPELLVEIEGLAVIN